MTTTDIAVFAMVLGYVALIAAYLALRTLARLRRAATVLGRGDGTGRAETILEAVQRSAAQTDALAAQVEQVQARLMQVITDADRQHTDLAADVVAHAVEEATAHAADVARSAVGAAQPKPADGLRNMALVRYDAFGQMSGRMSFSLALLDDAGDGVTISAISGAGDTRVYAKAIAAGKGEHDLSPEERQAVTSALERRHGGLWHRKAG